jgi:uncharacterized phage-associated protein
MYNDRKTAHMAAYLLAKTEGRTSHLKLMKLLYLSDRESMRLYGFSITGDSFVSMPHGPVLSMTLDLMNGYSPSASGEWEQLINAIKDHELSLAEPVDIDTLDELSKADTGVLDSVWKQFGHLDQWQLRDYTHNLKEWADPDGSSKPISLGSVFDAVGVSAIKAEEMIARVKEQDKVDRVFASL